MCIRNGAWGIISDMMKTILKRKSMRICLILFFILFGVSPLLVFRFSYFSSYETEMVESRMSALQNQCNILSRQLTNGNYMLDQFSDTMNHAIVMLANYYNGRIVVVDGNLKIIKDTYGLLEKKTLLSDAVIMGLSGSNKAYYDNKNEYIEITFPITDGTTKEVLGVMVASVSTEDISEQHRELLQKADVVLLAMTAVIALGAFLMAAQFVKPMKRMVSAFDRIAQGHIDEKLPVGGFTEIERVGEAVGMMLARLKALDESRQEFVSNVSHELKTPITSMKVLADSLLLQQEVPNELYKEFMVDIAAEIDRENKIITDLLSLMKLDKSAADLNISSIDMNGMLELLLKRLRPIAATRNIELVFESFRPVTAEIDEVKLTLAFSNLVENAIKYNYDDGWVKVSLNADHKYFYVKVIDSGVGIPEDVQDMVFERFYRVDKARSRETGGTGLGLSITRSIVLMHNGAIRLFSREKEGATFTVRIPLRHIG